MARKAIYVIRNGEVKEKRPTPEQLEDLRPFWPDRASAQAVANSIAVGTRTYYYKIVNGKIKRSWSTVEVEPTKNLFTSKQQLDEHLSSMAESIDYTITRGTISIFYNGKSYNITAADKRFGKLKKACLNEDNAAILDLVDLESKVKEVSGVQNGKVVMQGHETEKGLTKKIVETVQADPEVIRKFNSRLAKNPSKSAKNLLKFLNHHGCCFLEDGRFVAYKYVNSDFTDRYTGKLDYSPGKTVTMPRNKVVEDPNKPCQSGLHVGTWEYVRSNSTIVAVVVDPYNVVSVPNDYGHQKMRCCKVESVVQIKSLIDKPVITMKELKDLGVKPNVILN